jgi:hypothetical protein
MADRDVCCSSVQLARSVLRRSDTLSAANLSLQLQGPVQTRGKLVEKLSSESTSSPIAISQVTHLSESTTHNLTRTARFQGQTRIPCRIHRTQEDTYLDKQQLEVALSIITNMTDQSTSHWGDNQSCESGRSLSNSRRTQPQDLHLG